MSANRKKPIPLPQHLLQKLRETAVEEGMTEEQYLKYKRSMKKMANKVDSAGKKAATKVVIIRREVKPRMKHPKKNGHVTIPPSLRSQETAPAASYRRNGGLNPGLS